MLIEKNSSKDGNIIQEKHINEEMEVKPKEEEEGLINK